MSWPWELWLAAIGAFLLFLPDTDAFMLERAGRQSLVLFISGGRALPVCLKYTAYVAVFICPLALLALRIVHFSWPFVTVLVCCSLAGCWALFLTLSGDAPGYMAFRGPGFLNLLLLTFGFIITAAATTRPGVLRGLFLGLAGSTILKLLFAAAAYGTTGGVAVLGKISSLQADGGNLNAQVFVAAVGLALGTQRWLTGKRSQALWSFALFLLFTAAIGMSFRRLAIIRLIVVSLGSVLVLFLLWNRLRQGLLYVGMFALLLGLCLVGASVAFFGPALVKDRVLSLTSPRLSETSDSNESYLDDWRAWPTSISYSRFLGAGLGAYCGIRRPSEDSGAEVIPLHTGTFELWSSLGWAGMVFHLLALVVVPLAVLSSFRNCAKNAHPAAIVGIVFVMFVALAPFGGPFHAGGQTSLVIGAALGLLVGYYRPASEPLAWAAKRSPAHSFPSTLHYRPSPQTAKHGWGRSRSGRAH